MLSTPTQTSVEETLVSLALLDQLQGMKSFLPFTGKGGLSSPEKFSGEKVKRGQGEQVHSLVPLLPPILEGPLEDECYSDFQSSPVLGTDSHPAWRSQHPMPAF